MLVDNGAIVNLMPYSLFKKLGDLDVELVNTRGTISGVGGGEPMGAKGIASMGLTIGSKTITTAFFVVEMQGNFGIILGRDWIHANQCVPSSLHQFLVQWVDDEIEVIHGDTSVCTTADNSIVETYENFKCLSEIDMSDCEILTVLRMGSPLLRSRPIETIASVARGETGLTRCVDRSDCFTEVAEEPIL